MIAAAPASTASACSPLAVTVEGYATVTLRPAIHQAVARSGIETDRNAVRRQPRNIPDAADVDHCARFCRAG